ncbi:hypothetical protein BOTBODRAFT_58608 [Botryobasidium botryosum FD-172 SS1]|uniref:Uncharacterized protein n=1 Tax=Botryobasidium botryosum (strain FD-172 SS1) TaxID=930990 RepID=A0A067M1A2_BOTB1|nr:hypothetical protein BOTBODRAFT_58608 [Botryobasidium botryosum FD-172 SS1]
MLLRPLTKFREWIKRINTHLTLLSSSFAPCHPIESDTSRRPPHRHPELENPMLELKNGQYVITHAATGYHPRISVYAEDQVVRLISGNEDAYFFWELEKGTEDESYLLRLLVKDHVPAYAYAVHRNVMVGGKCEWRVGLFSPTAKSDTTYTVAPSQTPSLEWSMDAFIVLPGIPVEAAAVSFQLS